MTKVEKYNQALFAVGGSLVLFGLITGGVMVFLYDAFSRNPQANDSERYGNGEEKPDTVRVADTILTLDPPLSLDSVSHYYLIPVNGHRFESMILESEEPRYSHSGYFMDRGFSNEWRFESIRSITERPFPNALFFDKSKNAFEIMFPQSVYVKEVVVKGLLKSPTHVIFLGTFEDTNKDGNIDSKDLYSLRVYTINDHKMMNLNLAEKDILNFRPMGNDTLALLVGMDKDHNGSFDRKKEPSSIFFLNTKTWVAFPAIPESLDDSLSFLFRTRPSK